MYKIFIGLIVMISHYTFSQGVNALVLCYEDIRHSDDGIHIARFALVENSFDKDNENYNEMKLIYMLTDAYERTSTQVREEVVSKIHTGRLNSIKYGNSDGSLALTMFSNGIADVLKPNFSNVAIGIGSNDQSSYHGVKLLCFKDVYIRIASENLNSKSKSPLREKRIVREAQRIEFRPPYRNNTPLRNIEIDRRSYSQSEYL